MNAKINKVIAEAKGLKIVPPLWFYLPANKYPDYTSDPVLILELDTDLHNSGEWSLNNWDFGQWTWVGPQGIAVIDDDRGKATAMAWCEMKGINFSNDS